MIRTALVSCVFAVSAGAVSLGCTRHSAGTAESTTQAPTSSTPAAAAPKIQPTGAPNEPPPAELNDESAGVKDPPGEDPSAEPEGEDEASEDYE